jgi:DNA-directed RNA polymerase subunit H (RpoH/RPB5)
MGDSYKLYLQDTSILQHKHINALEKESDELMKLLGINKDALPNIVPVANEMGDY